MSILEVEDKRTISHKALKEAICLKCANCYGAMSFANALGGSKTDAWLLCHAYSLKVLLGEAAAQKIDLNGLVSAIDNQPIEQTMYYRRATGAITEEEFQAEFRKWQNS